ncbi:MAG: hypothetical protein HN348_18485, partial [Proteobacteria bacterium]|nr:hypothetical protein [Pseudomonadota bacterium]
MGNSKNKAHGSLTSRLTPGPPDSVALQPRIRFLVPASIGVFRTMRAVEHFEAFFRKTVSQPIKPIPIDSHTAMCEALLGRMPIIAWAPPMACARVVTHGGHAPLRLIRHGC